MASTGLPLHSCRQGPPARQSSLSTRSSGSKHPKTATAFIHGRDDGESYPQFFKQIRVHKHAVKLKHLLGRVLEHLFTKRSSQLLSVYSGAGTVRNIYTQELISFILTTSLRRRSKSHPKFADEDTEGQTDSSIHSRFRNSV